MNYSICLCISRKCIEKCLLLMYLNQVVSHRDISCMQNGHIYQLLLNVNAMLSRYGNTIDGATTAWRQILGRRLVWSSFYEIACHSLPLQPLHCIQNSVLRTTLVGQYGICMCFPARRFARKVQDICKGFQDTSVYLCFYFSVVASLPSTCFGWYFLCGTSLGSFYGCGLYIRMQGVC